MSRLINPDTKWWCGLFSLAAVTSVALAHNHGGYSHDSGVKHDNANWMARISDGVRLSQLSVPGTHDTMALYGGDAFQTQSMSLVEQLLSGVRALDIRCRHFENSCAIHHADVYQNASLDDVLRITSEFLQAHPGEAILMRLRGNEHTEANVSRTWEQTFLEYRRNYLRYIWNPLFDNRNPRLGDVRGKIVILPDQFLSNHLFDEVLNQQVIVGISYSDLIAQDWYQVYWGSVYDKWEKIKNHLNDTSVGMPDRIYINYLSAAAGVTPFFMASGHSDPSTGAPRLATGLTTPANSNTFPDYPRVDCIWFFVAICTIAYEGTNVLTSDLLERTPARRIGVIMADFPGPKLIDQIIRQNDILPRAYYFIQRYRLY
jgi:1-phosphatidylinositol phosphodiesterase